MLFLKNIWLVHFQQLCFLWCAALLTIRYGRGILNIFSKKVSSNVCIFCFDLMSICFFHLFKKKVTIINTNYINLSIHPLVSIDWCTVSQHWIAVNVIRVLLSWVVGIYNMQWQSAMGKKCTKKPLGWCYTF